MGVSALNCDTRERTVQVKQQVLESKTELELDLGHAPERTWRRLEYESKSIGHRPIYAVWITEICIYNGMLQRGCSHQDPYKEQELKKGLEQKALR